MLHESKLFELENPILLEKEQNLNEFFKRHLKLTFGNKHTRVIYTISVQ